MSKRVYIIKDNVYDYAKLRAEGLEKFIQITNEQIAAAPKGILRIIKNKNAVQYYHITKKGDHNGKYISKKNITTAKALAQRDYDTKTVAAAENQLKVLKKFLHEYSPHIIGDVFSTLKENRKPLVVPNQIPNDKWINNWLSVNFEQKPFTAEQPELFTAKGLRVRSKSEIIIAEALDRLNIPYRYEFPAKLKNYTVHPDFYCLNVNTCQEFIWEHFGLMDDADYSAKTVSKIADYQKAGYFPGKNLIISFENKDTPLNSKAAEEIIKQYLM